MTKSSWARLTSFLASEAEPSIVLSFQQIERILGHPLPASARRHAAFWSNTSSYSQAWLDAGRNVSRRGRLPEQIDFISTHHRSQAVVPTSEMPPRNIAPKSPGGELGAVEAVSVVRPEPSVDVLLLGCVKLKASTPQKAKDLYVSDLFGKRRRYAEQRGLAWFVLSAEHGLLHPDDWVAPYDVELRKQPASYRRAWGAWVIERLRRELGELTGARLELHAGDAYADALVEPATAAGATLIRPVQGLRQGEQLAWYLSRPGPPHASVSAPVADADVASGASAGQDADTFATSLRDATRAIPLADLVESQVPAKAGLYSWWVDEPGALALTSGLGHIVDAGLIYAGQAGATRWPSGQRSANTLRGRLIGMHRDGSVNFSTFRLTLAFALNLVADGRADEGALTEWMRHHLAIAWRSTDDPDRLAGVEHDVLGQLDPVLNLRGMHTTEVRMELTRRRSKKNRVLAARALEAPRKTVEPVQERKFMAQWRLNVTDKDINGGQIRITREAKKDMRLMEPMELQVRLRGELFPCTYDPRLGPDKERSGLIRLGKSNLSRLLGGPVELTAGRGVDGVLNLA
jgi:hypothetical protein